MRLNTLLQRVLAEKGLTTAQFAEATGYSVSSIHNLAAGCSKSRTARERVQKFLQAEIWPENPLPRRIVLMAGDQVDFISEECAKQWEAELGDRLHRVGRSVTLRESIEFVVHQAAKPAPGAEEGRGNLFDRRLNLLRRELAVRSEDFHSGRISIAEAKDVHRTSGKKLAALRSECAKAADPAWSAQVKLLATIRQILRVQIRHSEAKAAAKHA